MVSYPAWHHGISYRQETVCEGFPIRLGTDVFHTDRKLFAYGFLFGLGQTCFIPTGNCLRMVSYPAWHCCVSYRQETICVWFPIRLGTMAFHTDRKLFAKGFLSGLGQMCFIPTGNCLRMVSYPAWYHGISYRQETVCEGFPIRLGTDVFHTDRKLSHCPTISLIPTQIIRPAGFCFSLLLW